MDGLAVAAMLGELRPQVEGSFIRTAYQPTRDAFLFRLSGAKPLRLLISPRDAVIHLTERRIPNPEIPSGFAMLLRKHLRGGRIAGICQHGWDRVVTIHVERRSGKKTEQVDLVAELIGLRGNLLVVRNGVVVGAARQDRRIRLGKAYEPLPAQPKADPGTLTADDLGLILAASAPEQALAKRLDGVGKQTAQDLLRLASPEGQADPEPCAKGLQLAIDQIVNAVSNPVPHVDPARGRALFYPVPGAEATASFSAAFDRLAEPADELGDEEDQRAVRVHLQRALGRQARTAERLGAWLEDAGQADRLQREADLILTYLSEIDAGCSRVQLVDPATAEAIEIRLDPSLSAAENAQKRYRRARRLRRGRAQVEARRKRVEASVSSIEKALDALADGEPIPIEATSFLPQERVEAKTAPKPQAHRLEIEGHLVLVGRNAQDNDRLLQAAGPDDLWLHARGVAGSHVVIRRQGSHEIPATVVEAAAVLAAQHSKSRHERKVEVTIAEAKHVRKPKRGAPGLAIVRHEDTLTVRPNDG